MALNGGYSYRLPFPPSAQGTSLLDFLTADFRHSTRQVWEERLARGEVEVAGRPATGAEQPRPGTMVVWHRPPWDEPDVPLDYTLLYEDADLLAVTKPSGLPTLPGGGFLAHTLLTRVRADLDPAASPLHRLGRGTSGAVLFARTAHAAATLSADWRAGRVDKVYRALAAGHFPDAGAPTDLRTPIGPVPHPRLGRVHAATPTGKAAHSRARVLETRADSTLLDVEILTGRPHQIRIHLAAAGHPLVGDPLYGPDGTPMADLPGLPGDLGYLLHAHTLHFHHPVTGAAVQVVSPPPPTLRPAEPAE